MADASYLERLLTQTAPLDRYEVQALHDWLAVLQEDVDMFGETTEDAIRIRRIKDRIAREEPRP